MVLRSIRSVIPTNMYDEFCGLIFLDIKRRAGGELARFLLGKQQFVIRKIVDTIQLYLVKTVLRYLKYIKLNTDTTARNATYTIASHAADPITLHQRDM